MADVTEITKRRAGGRGARTDPLTASTKKHVVQGTVKDGVESHPPLWRWFSMQSAHSDPDRRAAAIHIKGRYNLPNTAFGKIHRDLLNEDSVYVLPFLKLLEEYRIAYSIDVNDDQFAYNVGTAGTLIPVYIEECGNKDCGREAIPGTGKCGRHGGAWISPKDAADLSRRIHDRLLQASERAVRVLEDLMDNGRSEIVRSTAAAQVLDRAGIGPHMNVHHDGEITISDSDKAAEALRARLDRLNQNVTEREQQVALESADVQDAEIVSETG